MRLSTIQIAMPRTLAIALVALFLVVAPTAFGPARAQSGSLAGVYDGGQMEMAAGLELKPDGSFNYALPTARWTNKRPGGGRSAAIGCCCQQSCRCAPASSGVARPGTKRGCCN